MNMQPTEQAIREVMDKTKMDYMQAYRHLQQRYQIQADLQRNPARHSMGKSAYDTDQWPMR
jgi:hypothetical protein